MNTERETAYFVDLIVGLLCGDREAERLIKKALVPVVLPLIRLGLMGSALDEAVAVRQCLKHVLVLLDSQLLDWLEHATSPQSRAPTPFLNWARQLAVQGITAFIERARAGQFRGPSR